LTLWRLKVCVLIVGKKLIGIHANIVMMLDTFLSVSPWKLGRFGTKRSKSMVVGKD